MTMPTVIVEIGFTAALTGTALHLDDDARGILDTNTLAADNLFTDVTAYVTSVNTRRGATRADGPTLRYEAGAATITFRNDDRRFDPTNLAGPYVAGGVTQVEPLRAVRIRATWNGRSYPLWRGFTDQWTVNYEAGTSTASVTCFDAFGIFAANNRTAVAAAGAGEDAGQRVSRILNAIGWPSGDRIVPNGDEKVQATTLAGDALTELLLTVDTELGEFWVDAKGRVVFRARSAPYSETRSKFPLALFGDQVVDGIPTTVNVVTNPSAETGITGWAGGGFAGPPTLTRSSTRAMFGTFSVLGTWATTVLANIPNVAYTVTGLTVGRVYTYSVYAYVPSGSPHVAAVIAAVGFGEQTTVFDQWVRLTVTTTATSTSHTFQLWALSDTTAGQRVYLDGLQVEEADTATDYVDGDQAGCEWDGVVHVSTSRRLPELPYADVDIAYDALSITNQITAARAGGVEQAAQDAGSVSAYLTRSHQRLDLLMQSDAEALMWAEQILARTSMPELRFASLALKPSGDATRLWPQAFGREIGDRIRVTRRPPGGGAPITREAWVRGVEHHLGADLDWRTTFVLEQARDTVQVTDSFTTTSSNGWGPADGGEVWTVTGTASEYAKSGGTGNHTHPTVNVLHSCFIDVAGGVNASVSADITVPVVPTGGDITLWVAGRVTDVNNHYLARLSIPTAGSPTLALFKRTSGALSAALASVTPPGLHAAGMTWRLQLDVLGTTLRTRTWRPATDPQPDWQATTTDPSLTAGTQAAVMSRREVGNTNASPVIAFDTFSASSRVTWD